MKQIIAFIVAWGSLALTFVVCLALASVVAWFFPEDMQGTISAGGTIGFLIIFALWISWKDKEDK